MYAIIRISEGCTPYHCRNPIPETCPAAGKELPGISETETLFIRNREVVPISITKKQVFFFNASQAGYTI